MTVGRWNRRVLLKAGAAAAAATFSSLQGTRRVAAQARTARPIVFRGATLITMDGPDGGVRSGDLLVRDGRIAAIGERLEAGDAQAIEAAGTILIPGLINSHIHLGQAIIRGLSGDHTLGEYFRVIVGRYSPKLTAEDLAASDYAGALEQLDGGVTTIFDWSREALSPAHADAAVDAMKRSGLKVFFGYAIPGPAQGRDAVKADIKRLLGGTLAARDGRVRMAAGVRGPDSSPPNETTEDLQFAIEHGLLHQFHIGAWLYQTRRARGTAGLAADKLLTPKAILVHANDLDEDEYKICADNGAKISVTPEVEMLMGHGQPATGRALRNGLKPGLGVDVVTGIGGDMFTQMRMALAAQRLADNLAAKDRKQPLASVTLTTRQVLAAATIDGARLLGVENETGSLTVGKKADLVMIRPRVGMVPIHDPISVAVLQAGASAVDTVLVDGEVVKADGRLVGHDLGKAMAELQKQAQALTTR